MMDLSQFSLNDLRQLQSELAKELARKERAERENAINQIYSIAHNLGIPLKDLLAEGTKKGKLNDGAGYPVVYRDKSNPDHTWCGRGPRPKWLKEAIAGGKKLEEFHV